MQEQTPIEPRTIDVQMDKARIAVIWNDGHESVYGWEFLRWQCPCAECRGEGGVPGKLLHTERLTPRQVELNDLRTVGRYGLTPRWADGHQTGIYTYRNLRAMCPCADCTGVAEES